MVVDARGKSCPMPIVLVSKAIRTLPIGSVVVVQADDRAFPKDIEAWCRKTGHILLSLAEKTGAFEAEIRRVA